MHIAVRIKADRDIYTSLGKPYWLFKEIETLAPSHARYYGAFMFYSEEYSKVERTVSGRERMRLRLFQGVSIYGFQAGSSNGFHGKTV